MLKNIFKKQQLLFFREYLRIGRDDDEDDDDTHLKTPDEDDDNDDSINRSPVWVQWN